MIFIPLLESVPNRIVISFIALFILMFFFQFVIPAIFLGRKLGSAIKHLNKIQAATNGSDLVDLEPIVTQAMTTKSLKHLWSEYTETLHPQKSIDESGQERVICWRATTMAEAFFTEQVLVDTPLKTEFYKHLPGILTGLGIIGTFAGLINGLTQFEVSNNPDAVRACLRNLIQGVGHAFWISASAIGLAMFLTWVEKTLVTFHYRQVEDLCQIIDSFFKAGAGEEYLARLVHASETSATQSMQLKDSLVTDLKQILSDITAQQVQASTKNTQQMSQDLAQAITDTMRLPMERISVAVDRASSNQGEGVNKMLTDVLVNFSAQMQDMFGGQLRGMTDLLGQTNSAMLGTVAKFDELAANMQNAGQGAADAMAEKLHEAIVAMETRQRAMTQQMQDFVEQMRATSRDSQSESAQRMQSIMTELGDKVSLMVAQLDTQTKLSAGSHETQLAKLAEGMTDFLSGMRDMFQESQGQTSQKLQESLGQLGEQVSLMVSRMDEQTKSAAGVHNDSLLRVTERMESFLTSTKDASSEAHLHTAQASQQVVESLGKQVQEAVSSLQEMAKRSEDASASRQTELAEQSAKLLGHLTSQVDALGRRVADAAESTKSSAASMASASKSAIERMNSGADSLLLATSELSDAEKRVAATMGAIGQTAQVLQTSASTLSGASSGVQLVFDDYKSSTGAFAAIVTELKATVETARREASLTTDLVSRLQGASDKLASASMDADHYLEGVTEVLSEAHATFAESVTKTMREGNFQFHKELSDAVGYLRTAILELGDTLDSVASKR
ncbi:MAG: anti-phage defense ZorAB system ZorA [Proteobacteria bacterium]|nr:anti-phage defense ZorAB system ZorA [Pseudomonadota bacterium]MCG2742603.1 anti-phage defense ZorAB system protein ZorA [Desulfobacteraceae bacterium]